jgi:hypothetical protein
MQDTISNKEDRKNEQSIFGQDDITMSEMARREANVSCFWKTDIVI